MEAELAKIVRILADHLGHPLGRQQTRFRLQSAVEHHSHSEQTKTVLKILRLLPGSLSVPPRDTNITLQFESKTLAHTIMGQVVRISVG